MMKENHEYLKNKKKQKKINKNNKMYTLIMN